MPAEKNIDTRVRNALAEYLRRDAKTIKPTDALRDDLGLDSMSTIELLYQIEDVFDVQIPDRDLEVLTTVADVTAYLERKLASGKPKQKKKV